MKRLRRNGGKTIGERQVDYDQNWQTVTSLMNYNMGHVAFEDVRLTPLEAKSMLETDGGKQKLQRWISCFSKTFALMIEFNSQRESGVAFNSADWRLMDQSAAEVVGSLTNKLLETKE